MADQLVDVIDQIHGKEESCGDPSPSQHGEKVHMAPQYPSQISVRCLPQFGECRTPARSVECWKAALTEFLSDLKSLSWFATWWTAAVSIGQDESEAGKKMQQTEPGRQVGVRSKIKPR